MSQSLADDPFAAPTPSIRRASARNGNAHNSPPTSSDTEMDDGRPSTPVMQMTTGRRKCPPIDYIDAERRTPSPKNVVSSRGKYAMDIEDHEDDDPFAAPKKNSRVYQGQGLKKPDGHVMTYVFRGKKVKLTQPVPASDSEEEELQTAGPKFLFPQHAPDSPVVASIQASPKKPGTPPKNNSGIPPTPQSNIRRGTKRTFGHAPSDSISVLKDESDDDSSLFCPESLLNKRARHSQQMDFARRVGGSTGTTSTGQGRVLFR